MDPSSAAAPTGFVGWIMANGQIVVFVAQLAYWFFMVLFVGYAVAQFKRWVNFQLGTGHSGQLNADAKPAAQPTVSVEEFVE